MIAHTELIPLVLICSFLAGALWVLLLGFQDALAGRPETDPDQVRRLVRLFHITFPPMALIGGLLLDKIGLEWVLVGGFLTAALALALLAVKESFPAAVATVILLGAGGGAALTASMALAAAALFPAQPAASFGIAMLVTSLGVVIMPWLTDPVHQRLGLRRGLGLLALGCLIPVFLVVIQPPPQSAGAAREGALVNPLLLVAGLVVFLVAPVETVVRTWAGPDLVRLGSSEATARRWVAVYWVAYLGSRLAVTPLTVRGPVTAGAEPWLVLGLILLTAVALGNLAGATGRVRAGWGLLLVGLALGPVLPLLAGVLVRRFPDETGAGLGVLFALGSLGSLTLVPLLDRYAHERTGYRAPMLSSLTAGIAALALALLAISLPKT